MLEGALEQLLLQFLAPYVDGISRDKLHLGVFSGSLELKDLAVRPDALTLLGLEGFRVRRGKIKFIKLSVPWSKLYSGKLWATVEKLHIEVESLGEGSTADAKLIKEIQEAKQKAIEVRMNQLHDLMEQQQEQEHMEANKKRGMVVRLIRKIVNNITIQLIDVSLAFVNSKRGLACQLDFPQLAVLSTDHTFREWDTKEVVDIADQSMYKVIKLQELGIRMAPAGSNDIGKAEYVLSPISVSLQLAHVPSDQILRVKLQVATEELAEVILRRSQVKHLRSLQADLQEEALRLRALVVPPGEERSIHMDVEASTAEYARLYERHLLHEWKINGEGDEPLAPHEQRRRQLLEDAFSVRLIARERWKLRRKFEALHSEVARRQEEAERVRQQAERTRTGFLGRFRSRWAGSDSSASSDSSEGAVAWLAPGEREQLLHDIDDESKVETVDLPQRLGFEFLLGQMALDFVDDRRSDEVQRQLLSLALKEANWQVDVRMATDHRGQDSAEWRTEICLGSFRALHTSSDLLRLHEARGADVRGTSAEGTLTGDDCSRAARLVLESKLMEEQNLLALCFDFMPLEIHFLPGIVELLLEFVRAPERPPDSVPLGVGPAPQLAGSSESRVEGYVDFSKQLLEAHSDRAKEMAQKVYECIPDKMLLDVRIASPIVHVPVTGLGTSKFSLGELHIHTPEACEYRSIDLSIELNHTEMRAESVRKERFDMIQPVPVRVMVEYRSFEEENCVNVTVQVAEMALALAPQAVQILLSTPSAIMSVLYPAVDDAAMPAPATAMAEGPSAGASASVAGPPGLGAEDELETEGDSARWKTPWRAKDLAQHVLGTEGDELLEAAARRVEEVRSKQFRLHLTMLFDALDLTLADSIMPVMRFRAEFLKPGLILFFQKSPNLLTMNIGNGTLLVEVLNPRNGAWEPLAERFHLGLELERRAVGEDGRATRICVTGHEPLLLNFTPTAVQSACWIVPLFLEGLYGTPAEDASVVTSEAGKSTGLDTVKYRVVNVCDVPLELSFRSRHREKLQVTVSPTGSEWQSLDDWVLPYFSTAVAVGLPGGRPSEALSLERAGAVAIPGSGFVAEVLTHSPSHRLVLLATPLRVHNQTDLTLIVRFHQAVTRDTLPLELPKTTACDAMLLGHTLPAQKVRSQYDDAPHAALHSNEGVLLLQPNAVCAVPAPALIRKNQASISSSHTWLSVRPVALNVDFCAPVEVGARVEPCSIFCRGRGQGSAGLVDISTSGGVHFTCESGTYTHSLPAFTVLTTVVLQPTLALLNALPFGDLAVRYTRSAHDNRWRDAAEVKIPCFTRLNIYNFPGVRREGIAISARLHDTAPWSTPPVSFSRESFEKEGAAPQTLHLRHTEKGAAAGVTVEPLNHLEMRLACPNWFVDRSGLGAPLELELHHHGRRLPRAKGITLLPLECTEENCELFLRAPGGVAQTHSLRMPPSWCVFPWKTPSRAYVFCVQADDVAAGDVLGAPCQVMTLRPRLMLTNSSPCEIELRLTDSNTRLAPGHSMEHHWQVKPGEEDDPTYSLCFRPLRGPPCRWSSTVICGDAAAGSIPYMLPAAVGSAQIEVWSVEVAPVRGALAVSFRQGSDFIAVNRSNRKDLSVAIRSADCDEAIPSLPLPCGGQEVPYGWLKPFQGEQRRGVVVLVNGRRYAVEDARLSMRRTIRLFNLAIVVTLMGTKTILSLEDCEASAIRMGQQEAGLPKASSLSKGVSSGGSALSVEVKLSRLGISVIEEVPVPRELLFLHFELLRLEWKRDEDLQQLKLAVSEAQVDCQLPGRVDVRTLDRRRDESLGLWQQERPAVILANCAEGDRAFFTLIMRRGATSSRDILVPFMDVSMDALDITVDDKWLVPFKDWMDKLWSGKQRGGVPFEQVQQTAGEHIEVGYKAPPLPFVVQMDHLHIAPVNITMWCALKLKSVSFLPPYMRTALRVLSFSGQFTLDGALLRLEDRIVPPHRGSLKDFVWGLASEYATNLLNNAAAMLGKSSVLNLPRVPLRVGMTGVSYMSDSLGLAFGEAASLLGRLTFDEEYVAQQRQIRKEKTIRGLHDGVVEAGKSLAQGVEGLFDVVTKPIEGAQKAGIGGFFTGMGKGVAGTFVKPISKIGQAFSDVGSGIAAAVAPDTASMKRRRMRPRLRQPRLLFSQLGIVRPWSELEAELLRQLGERLTYGVEEVVPMAKQGSGRLVLMLFPRHLLIVEVKAPGALDDEAQAGPFRQRRTSFVPPGGSSSSSLGTSMADSAAAKRVDFFDAIEESAQKLVSQGLKPINTVVYGVQDIESKLQGKQGDDPEAKAFRRFVRGEYEFKELKAVHVYDKGMIKLEDHQGRINALSLESADLSQAAFAALANGFRSAQSHHDGVANWDELQTVLREERRYHNDEQLLPQDNQGGKPTGAGQRTLEVFEVERKLLATGEWVTPFLLTDVEMSWRWLDSTGYRHPHLRRRLTREQCVAKKLPPCELDGNLFKPASEWTIDKGPDTDPDGWKYGIAWNSSTWDAKPNLFNGMRKRRWTRIYS